MQIESIALVRLAAAAALLQMPISAASAAPTAASAADTPAASSAAPAEGPLSHDEIREAVTKVAGDSNLAGRQKSRELRWRQPQAPPANTPSWAAGFFGFLAQSRSVLFWVAGAASAVSAAIGLIRWLRALPPAIEPSPAARARSVAERITAGRVLINTLAHEPLAPFGGFKQSGIGREYGVPGLEAFLEPKAVLGGSAG